MSIEIKQTVSLWGTILGWFRGNSRLVKQGEYLHYKAHGNQSTAFEKGDVLTGFFEIEENGKYMFGNAVYLGDTHNPNYKMLNFTDTEL